MKTLIALGLALTVSQGAMAEQVEVATTLEANSVLGAEEMAAAFEPGGADDEDRIELLSYQEMMETSGSGKVKAAAKKTMKAVTAASKKVYKEQTAVHREAFKKSVTSARDGAIVGAAFGGPVGAKVGALRGAAVGYLKGGISELNRINFPTGR